jgi:hypothetical protein
MGTASMMRQASGVSTAVVAASAMVATSAVMAPAMVAAAVSALGLGQARRQSDKGQDQTCRPDRPQQ